jgi:ribonuclease HI
MIEVFTDGACRGNPGPGGWGVLMRIDGEERSLSGFAPDTTNNRMELTAAIEGLAYFSQSSTICLTTDSQYVRQGITQWITGWKRNGWRTSNKQPVKNQDLWQQLDALAEKHTVSWFWVKGHSGHVENERADQLATQAIDQMTTAS